jgi:hypothetical protein
MTLHHENICMLDLQALSASWQTSWHPCPADQTLAREVGHYLGLIHTWFQGDASKPAQEQCTRSASLDIPDIVSGLSDGVRDTPAISLNVRAGGKIIRFVNCTMYEHTSNAPLMQQSCTTATANFPRRDRYYNPVSANGELQKAVEVEQVLPHNVS